MFKKFILFILIVFLFSVMFIQVNYLADIYNLRWDLTEYKQHTLNDFTLSVIKGMKKEVKVTCFYVGMPPKYLEDILRSYSRNSDLRISTEIINPIEQLGYASQFGNIIDGKRHLVFVQSGDARKEIDFTQEPLSEEQLTNTIVRVLRKHKTVYFTNGHSENKAFSEDDAGLSKFVNLLADNNITSRTVMIDLQGEVPEDCDLLIIAGAKKHLTERENLIVSKYLNSGGEALFLIENIMVTTPDKPLTEQEALLNPSLNNILNKWGVEVASDVVVDLANYVGQDVGSPATKNYLKHKAIVSDLDYTFYVRPRSLSMIDGRRSTIRIAPLVLTTSKDSSWGETNRTLDVKYNEGVDVPGPVPIAFVIWEPKYKGKDSDTRMAVYTDSDFLTNIYIDQHSNAQMGVNVVNWLIEEDYKTFLSKEHVEVPRLDLTSGQKNIIKITLVAVPSVILLLGLFVWFRTRN